MLGFGDHVSTRSSVMYRHASTYYVSSCTECVITRVCILVLLLQWYFQVWWIVPRRYSGLFERTMMVKWGLDLHTTVARLRTFATFPVLTNTEMSACGVSRIIQHPGQMVITEPVCRHLCTGMYVYRRVSNPCVLNKAYGLLYLLNLIYMVLNTTPSRNVVFMIIVLPRGLLTNGHCPRGSVWQNRPHSFPSGRATFPEFRLTKYSQGIYYKCGGSWRPRCLKSCRIRIPAHHTWYYYNRPRIADWQCFVAWREFIR